MLYTAVKLQLELNISLKLYLQSQFTCDHFKTHSSWHCIVFHWPRNYVEYRPTYSYLDRDFSLYFIIRRHHILDSCGDCDDLLFFLFRTRQGCEVLRSAYVCMSVCLSACVFQQEALLSQTDRATRCVSGNLANFCITVQEQRVRQIQNKAQ